MLLEQYKKKCGKFWRKTLTKLRDTPLPPATEEETQLVDQLRDEAAKWLQRPEYSADRHQPEWVRNVRTLGQDIQNRDPREFLRWHVVTSAMFAKYGAYVDHEFRSLKRRRDWESRWATALTESHVGHPIPYYRYPGSSPNQIHQAYHLAQFETATGDDICRSDVVFEFGGGYGCMCRLVHNLGFKGRYVIFDLPGFTQLQRFYLRCCGLPVISDDRPAPDRKGIFCTCDIEQLRKVLRDWHAENSKTFIATWSISEAPKPIRQEILPLVADFTGFLIAYQDQFEGIDNIEFFSQWKAQVNHIEWHAHKTSHLPGGDYLLGGKNRR